MRSKFTDKDKGWRRIMGRIKAGARRGGPMAVVGWTQATGDRNHPESDDLTIVGIAAVHEYGSPERKIPQRSMLRAVAEDYKRWQRMLRNAVRDDILLKRPLKQGLERLGLAGVAAVQKRINAGIPPALSDARIEQKGSSLPLVDNGHLKGAITHEVRQ